MNRTVNLVIELVCAEYGVSRTDLLSKDKHKSLIEPRMCLYYVLRNVTTRSFPEIAYDVGKRDHTTVMSGVKKHALRMAEDPDCAESTARVMATVKNNRRVMAVAMAVAANEFLAKAHEQLGWLEEEIERVG